MFGSQGAVLEGSSGIYQIAAILDLKTSHPRIAGMFSYACVRLGDVCVGNRYNTDKVARKHSFDLSIERHAMPFDL